jgi:hypothetical protein
VSATSSAASDGPLIAALLARAEHGWSIIPCCAPLGRNTGQCIQHGWCEAPGKVPLVKWAQYQAEIPGEELITAWWTRWPTANLALVTGELSGVVVVDLDGDLASAEAERRGGFEDGPTSLTGRIGGRHVFCQWRPDAPTIFAKRSGIDFRGQGGYVLLPQSVHANGNLYRWARAPERGEPLPLLPDWVLELARETQPSLGVSRQRMDPEAAQGAPQGMRNDSLARLVGAWRYYEHIPEDDALRRAFEYAAKCSPPMTPAEAKRVVRSIFRYPEHEGPAPPQLHEILPQARHEQLPLPGFWETAREILETEEETAAPLIGGLLWAARAHWLFSGPGAGKTMAALAAAIHIAAGKPFMGRAARQGGVLIIEEDSARNVISEYVRLLCAIYEIDPEGLPVYFNRRRGTRLRTQGDYNLIRAALDEGPADVVLVIIDACERIVPSKDFDSAELEWLGQLLSQCANRGIATLVIDHTRKHQAEGPTADPLDELYGGRAKSAISDVIWRVQGKIETHSEWSCVKFRGEGPPAFQLSFDSMQGFTQKTEKVALKPPEQQVMRVLNNTPREEWLDTQQIMDAITASGSRAPHPRALLRTLQKLLERESIERDGSTRDTVFRADRTGSTLWT